MKTPVQEFYEFMEQHQYFIGNDLFKKYHDLLEEEKDVIIKAYETGDKYKTEISGEKYYNETFKSK